MKKLAFIMLAVMSVLMSGCGAFNITYKVVKCDGREYTNGAPKSPYMYITNNTAVSFVLRADQNQVAIPIEDRQGKLVSVMNSWDPCDEITIGNRYIAKLSACVAPGMCAIQWTNGRYILHSGPMAVSPAYGQMGIVPQYQQAVIEFTDNDFCSKFGEGYLDVVRAYYAEKTGIGKWKRTICGATLEGEYRSAASVSLRLGAPPIQPLTKVPVKAIEDYSVERPTAENILPPPGSPITKVVPVLPKKKGSIGQELH